MLRTKLVAAAILGGAVMMTANLATAAVPGFYAGVQGGWSNIAYNTSDYVVDAGSVKKSGFGGRPFIGYQLDQYFGIETGYTWYAKNKLRNGSYYDVSSIVTTGDFKQSAWDIVAVGTLPLEQGFSLYAKGGAAYVNAKATETATDASLNGSFTISDSTHEWRPVAGVGVSYDFNEMVSGDVSWTRVFSGSGIANSDLAAVGVTYHFG